VTDVVNASGSVPSDYNAAHRRSGYLFALVCVLLWASFVLLSRIAGTSALNGFDLTALRFGVASLVLLPLWIFWRRVPLFNKQMLALASTGGLGYALLAYTAFHFAPASHGAVLLSGVLPFFVTVFAWWLLDERPSHRRWLALVVIALGVSSMAMYSLRNLRNSWPGDVLMIAGSAVWGMYTVLVKRWSKAPWDVTIGVGLLSAVLYLPVYCLFLPKGLFLAPWQAIVVQGLFHGLMVVIVAMLCYMQAMVRLGPTRLGAMMALVPAIAGLGAVIVLNEPYSWWLVTGLCLTSGGAWLGARS
jgi:drug/metabolite transporter (DMT)-like permease